MKHRYGTFLTAHNNLGIALVLEKQGRYAEAAIHLRQALRLNPDYAPAHSNLRNLNAKPRATSPQTDRAN